MFVHYLLTVLIIFLIVFCFTLLYILYRVLIALQRDITESTTSLRVITDNQARNWKGNSSSYDTNNGWGNDN